MATVRKRGNSYQIRVSTGYDINGNQVIRTKTWKPYAGMTQRQIENELNKQKVLFEQQCERGIVPVDVKFQVFAEQWFDEYANANLKKSTIQRFKSVSIRIYKTFGHLRVDKITHGQIQAFIDDLSQNQKNMLNGKPLSRKSVIHHLNLLSDIFNYAIRLEMIEFNPCSHIYIPKGEKKEKQIYTVDEMKQLFNLVEQYGTTDYKAFLTLAVYSGFRSGEIMGLEWRDIDWENNVISIVRTANYTAIHGTYTDTPKTKNSVRSLKLPDCVFDALKEMRNEQLDRKEIYGTKWIDNDRVFVTENDCYKKGTKMTGGKPTGIVVHSTGANNKTLKRYVQPLTSDSNYAEIIADIGTNLYGNHWNQSAAKMGRSVCVHAFIGVNAAGKVETYQTLPFDICCWGVGSGAKGSYNYNPQARVQFEICEDALTDRAYFDAAFTEAIEFCAYLCKTYGFGVDKISSHRESYLAGYGGNHGDCDHWLAKFGLTMDWFRSEVQKLLDKQPVVIETTTATAKTLYYVQTGAYASKSNAENQLAKVKAAGFDAILKKSGSLYKVQVGAYSVKANATAMASKLQAAGFSTYVTTTGGDVVSTTSSTASSEAIKVGDKVKCKAGVKTFSNGAKMASWVPSAVLYVRKIESNGTIYLVSTKSTGTSYTGRVKASDVYKI